MANALVRHVEDEHVRRHSVGGRRLGMSERLDRVLDHDARGRLARWYWAMMFLGARQAGKLNEGPERLAQWLADGGAEPSEIQRARAFLESDDYDERLTRATRRDPEYFVLEAVLSKRGARDFFTGELISVRRMFAPSNETLGVDVHHLIPQRWSRVASLDDRLRGRIACLANLTPLARATNRQISNAAPATYLARLGRKEQQSDPDATDAALKDHLIDPTLLRRIGEDTDMLDDHVEAFLADRLKKIKNGFLSLLGGADDCAAT
jgi:hypothetical protein